MLPVAEELVVVDSEQELGQVRCRRVNLDPRHDLKEEGGVPVKLLGDVLDLRLFPGGKFQRLGQQEQRAERVAQLHHLLQTVHNLGRGETGSV